MRNSNEKINYCERFILFCNQFILLIMVCALTSLSVFAQSGSVRGKVVDKATGEPLWGANIFIEGTSRGTASDREGNYLLQLIPEGDYTLNVKYIGFKGSKTDIKIIRNRIIQLDIALESEVIEGEEVVISAQAFGQKQAINQQISSRSIKNVVSAAKIEEIPDATAAESLGRLPGVSINRSGGEANKVTVRGLAPRFNNVQLDGVPMKSTDLNDRSTDISMISPNMLAGIEITKALTPDMEANSLGGVINLTIKEAPENLHYDLSMEGGYDSHRESINNYKFVGSLSDRFFENKLGIYFNGYIEQRNRGTNVLNPNFIEDFRIPEADRPFTARFTNVSFVDRAEVRQRIGATLVLDYKIPGGIIKLSNFLSQMDRDILTQSQTFSYEDILFQFALNKGGRNIQLQTVNKLTGNFDLFSGQLDISLSHSLARRDQPLERVLGGKGGYDYIEDPGNTDYLSFVNRIDEFPSKVDGDDFTDLVHTTQNSHDSKDRELRFKFDYEMPFNIGGIGSASLKLGGLYKYNTRFYDYHSQRIIIARNAYSNVWQYLAEEMPEVWVSRNDRGEINWFDAVDDHFDNDLFLDGKYNLQPFMSLEIFDRLHDLTFKYYRENGYVWDTMTNSFTSDQDGKEKTLAGYIMTDIRLLNKKLVLIPGVRYEKVDNNYTGYELEMPLSNLLREWVEGETYFRNNESSIHENWFPMIHLRFFPTAWSDIRFAFTKTASRPNYTDLVPWVIENKNASSYRAGNPGLRPQISQNLDLYFSVYSNHVGLASVGLFQKEIDDLIWPAEFFFPTAEIAERYGLPGYQGFTYRTVVNNEYKATLKGLEFEWQTHFWYLPSPFNNLVFNFNYTYIESETRYPYQVVTQPPGFPPPPAEVTDTSYAGTIAGQPKNVFNLSLGYDYKGFSAYITYLYQDGSLTSINRKEYLNSYAFDYDRWDIKVKQKLPFKGLELFLNLNNITDTGDRSFFQRDRYIDNEEYYGFSSNLGIRYRM